LRRKSRGERLADQLDGGNLNAMKSIASATIRESILPHETDTLTLGLMMKYWDVGQVKTRLGASVGMERAASLHRLFVSHLSASLANVADRKVACLSPDSSLARFRLDLESWGLGGIWDVTPQGGGDLGDRISRWFIHFLRNRSSRAILIGADCPTLDSELIRHAADLLRRNQVVLGPAADGGYYLIGLRGSWESDESVFEPLFHDIPWSTQQVMNVTRQRLRAAGLSHAELETREDVDTIVELQNLRASIAGGSDRHARLRSGIDRILSDPSFPAPSPQ